VNRTTGRGQVTPIFEKRDPIVTGCYRGGQNSTALGENRVGMTRICKTPVLIPAAGLPRKSRKVVTPADAV